MRYHTAEHKEYYCRRLVCAGYQLLLWNAKSKRQQQKHHKNKQMNIQTKARYSYTAHTQAYTHSLTHSRTQSLTYLVSHSRTRIGPKTHLTVRIIYAFVSNKRRRRRRRRRTRGASGSPCGASYESTFHSVKDTALAISISTLKSGQLPISVQHPWVLLEHKQWRPNRWYKLCKHCRIAGEAVTASDSNIQ